MESHVVTQRVERTWGSAKERNKRQRGTHRQHLVEYLVGFAWCQLRKDDDIFDAILKEIALEYPLGLQLLVPLLQCHHVCSR